MVASATMSLSSCSCSCMALSASTSRCPVPVPVPKRALTSVKAKAKRRYCPFPYPSSFSFPYHGRTASSSRGGLLAPRSFAHLVEKVTAEELDKLLEGERKTPIVVDFFATWCGPCVILAQELEKLAAEYANKVKFVKIDTDEEYELATEMEIRGLPTLVFISTDANKNAIRTEGLLPSETIRDIIDTEL